MPQRTDHQMGREPAAGERRQNQRLRELIDEMLASIRVAARRDLWTEEERRQYEDELAAVMQRVQFEAVWRGPSPAQRGASAAGRTPDGEGTGGTGGTS